MKYNTYILCGPDGSGKSTLAKKLSEKKWFALYGGKKENHYLCRMKINYKVYIFLKRFIRTEVLLVYLYSIFYVIEYYEYMYKTSYALKKNREGANVVFDRFYTDRMWKKFLKSNPIVYTLNAFYYKLYFKLISRHRIIPDVQTLFTRRKNDYKSEEVCSDVVVAYKRFYNNLKEEGVDILLLESQNINQNIQNILQWK